MVKIKEFDVFLCYNSNDRREVEKIAKQLKTRGINSWDKSEVPPGSLWQQELERQIENIKAVAVFIGNNLLGSWDNNEIQPFLRQFVKRGCPVIPVLLANAPEKPKLPLFLEENIWVDFRDSQSNPLEMLIWGIKGRRPLQLTLEDSEPEEFDVFLSHNSRDKDSVRIIANKLKKEGIVTWLDESQFVGGDEWQAKLYKTLDETNLAFFFIGKNGIGKWQYEEVDYLYNSYVSSGRKNPKIVPIPLPGSSIDNLPSELNYLKRLHSISLDSLDDDREISRLLQICLDIRAQSKSTQAIQTSPVQPNPQSEVGYDYKKLETLLSQGNWKKADEETARCMLKITKREEKGWLDEQSINNFPCQELYKIDQLWLKYSSHKFGFSVQKEIYHSLGGAGNAASNIDLEIWKLFGDKVGWRQGGKWLSYSELVFNLETANEGHLPGWGGEGSGGLLGGGRRIFIGGVSLDHHYLMQKLFKCNS